MISAESRVTLSQSFTNALPDSDFIVFTEKVMLLNEILALICGKKKHNPRC